MVFSDWLLWLTINFKVDSCCSIYVFIPFYSWIQIHFMNIPHLFIVLIRDIWVFSSLGYYKQCCCKHWCTCIQQHINILSTSSHSCQIWIFSFSCMEASFIYIPLITGVWTFLYVYCSVLSLPTFPNSLVLGVSLELNLYLNFVSSPAWQFCSFKKIYPLCICYDYWYISIHL